MSEPVRKETTTDDAARRPSYGKCVHCGCGSDQFGYAHADRCPCRPRADLEGKDRTI